MIMAYTMEHIQLHRRLALLVLSFVGSSTKWSMAGLMGVTAFLSMWINNSASASIMMPAAIAIIDEVENYQKQMQQQEQASEIERQSRNIATVDKAVALDVETINAEKKTEQLSSHDSVSINCSELMISYVTDGTTAILIGSLPLILPDQNPFQKNWKYKPILQWNQLSKSFPWGVFMLQGAGLAIADGFKASDLSTTIASSLQFIVGAPKTLVIFVAIVIGAVFTVFTTTPPNAMIFSSGHVKIMDMIKAGIGIKIIGILVILLASTTFLGPIFHVNQLPSIVNAATMMTNNTIG
ncbi:unnamed protein product [Rotaria sp. Silwood2]|nr:unnamed protein product [Rotaria sp. Silwood2]CAF4314496.1 unnamed protein product [Rotaria sp. Silwood2]